MPTAGVDDGMAHWEHLEKLLNALYLKEIDQEENVWRSLPFFSATLAVEVVILNQALPAAATMRGPWWWAFLAAGMASAALIVSVIVFLYRSIRKRSFSYIAGGTDLITYVRALEQASEGLEAGVRLPSIHEQLRQTLIEQLAVAFDANRAINQARARERSRAGILLLLSIVTTFWVFGVTIGHDIAVRPRWDASDDAGSGPAAGRSDPSAAGDPNHASDRTLGQRPASEDARREQGVELPRGTPDPRAGRGPHP